MNRIDRFDVHLPAATPHRVRLEALLDESLSASFPSSDPIALTAPAAAYRTAEAASQ